MSKIRIGSSRKFQLFGVLCFLFVLNYGYIVLYGDHISISNTIEISKVSAEPSSNSSFVNVVCNIDDIETIKCKKIGNEIYIPFSFIGKQFDVTGKIKGDDLFEWSTSYAKMRLPEERYNSTGAFGHFASYNVETRDRVRCINPSTGVPMSTQWSSTPYYYPIQIAQYGLQHYSQFVGHSTVEEVVVGEATKQWRGSPGSISETSERVFYKDDDGRPVANVSTSGDLSNPGAYVDLTRDPRLTHISLELLPLDSSASFSVLLSLPSLNQLLMLHYVPTNDSRCVWGKKGNAADEQVSAEYSLPLVEGEWHSVQRDIVVDASRAMAAIHKKKGSGVLRPGHISVRQRIVQSTALHRQSFVAAADWFVANQGSEGEWRVGVERKIAEGRLVLPPGWVSAMGQGHGLSLLTRAYSLTKEDKYLHAAVKAISLFTKNASDGGVRNWFLGVPWFEEYPTTPGTFVLNGFLYSLIGLFDLSSLPSHPGWASSAVAESRSLLEEGLHSLSSLLPLYDTGSGSVYDLRHVALKTPPNLARWDYHAVHVYLLKWLVAISGESSLDEVAERWIGYAHGKRAKHN